MAPHNSLARLESLPAEIVQQIFLYNCNISLPRASPVIALKLSAPYVYKEFCARVFSCVKEHTTQAGLFHCWDREKEEELMGLRSEALKCRWLTWKVFSEHRAWVRSFGRTSSIVRDGDQATTVSNGPEVLDLCLGVRCRIPRKLLKYPCERSNLEFLRTLIQLGATIDGTASLDLEVVEEMWYAAAVDRDYPLVHLLMQPGIYLPTEEEQDVTLHVTKHDLGLAWLLVTRLYPDLRFNDMLFWELPRPLRIALVQDATARNGSEALSRPEDCWVWRQRHCVERVWKEGYRDNKEWIEQADRILRGLSGELSSGGSVFLITEDN